MNANDQHLQALITSDSQLAFLPSLVKMAERLIQPSRIILFGSRARGDAHRRSDVDLAFFFDGPKPPKWAEFTVVASDELPTLLDLDLVVFQEAPDHLRQSISTDGKIVYERKSIAQVRKS